MLPDRKRSDASQTPAGGTDSTVACTESCSRKNREALSDRSQHSHSKNNNNKKNPAVLHKTFTGIELWVGTHTNVDTHWYIQRHMHKIPQIQALGNRDIGSGLRTSGVSMKKVLCLKSTANCT